MIITKKQLKRFITSYIGEGEVIDFPVSRAQPDEPTSLSGSSLEKLAVQRGTLIQQPDGSYAVNPDLDWSQPPYDTLMGTIGDQDLIGDIEDFGPYEYQINISKARGPVDTAELSGVWHTGRDVEEAVNMLIYGGGMLGDLMFKSINPKYADDSWRSMRQHIGFDEYPEEERAFYEEFGDHYSEAALSSLDQI